MDAWSSRPRCLLGSNFSRRNTFPKETGCHLQTSDADRQSLNSNSDAGANLRNGRGTYMERDNKIESTNLI